MKNRWMYSVVLALLVMGGINAYLVRTAFHSAMPPIDDDSYEHGMDYQKDITAMQNAQDAGIAANIGLVAPGTVKLTISAPDMIASSIRNAQVRFIRPSDATLDITESVTSPSPEILLHSSLLSGLWLFELRGELTSGAPILVKKQTIL